MSVLNVYVDPAFDGLDNGDSAVWNSAQTNRLGVVIGTDGFASLSAGIAAVTSGGTVWLSADGHTVPATITKSCVIRGTGAKLGLTGNLASTPTLPEYFALAPLVVSGSGVQVRFRDVEFESDGDTPPLLVKATSGAVIGITHCTFTGAATVGALADGTGAAVVANGCTFPGTVTTRLSANGLGGTGIFARTSTPVGGPVGRRGNHLRHKLLIEAPAQYRTAARSQENIWVPVDECYGSIEPLRAAEVLEAKLAGALATHRIEMPGGLTVTPAFRVSWRERLYELSASLTTDARENRMSFMASERQG